MIKPAKFACNGGEFTIAEIARQLGVSSETVRIRLSKCGGDMQKVWDHYAGCDKNEAAVNEIMSALGMDEAEEEEPNRPEEAAPEEPETAASEDEEQPAGPEDIPEMPMDAAPLAALRRLNRAIEGLSGMYEQDVGELARDTARFIGELRAYRARKYEKYVDWNAVAHAR